MSGPGSSTNNAVVRWDGTGGDTIQNSAVIISDTNNVTGVVGLTATTVTANTSMTMNLISMPASVLDIDDSSGNEYLSITASGDTAGIVAGDDADFKGLVRVNRKTTTANEAGVLYFEDEDGVSWFLWVDTTGDLRISTTDPGTNDLAGTVVGSQS